MSKPRSTEDYDETNTRASERLESCGIKRRLWAHIITGRWSVIFISMAFLLFGALITAFEEEAASAMVALFLGLVAVFEWRLAKTEAALDKFYDRLNLTNERLRFWKKPRTFISEQWTAEDTFEMEMYACLEVDNLEYVIQKYERGYMEAVDALREFTCFSSRCHEGKFKNTAITVAKRGGYKVDTLRALERICRICPQNVCPHSDRR